MPGSATGVAAVCRALGDDTRVRILQLLQIRELCVCELVDLFDKSQPAISEHLRRLREVGLVVGERRGMWVYYHLQEPLPDYVTVALAAALSPDLTAHLKTLTSRCEVPTRTRQAGVQAAGPTL